MQYYFRPRFRARVSLRGIHGILSQAATAAAYLLLYGCLFAFAYAFGFAPARGAGIQGTTNDLRHVDYDTRMWSLADPFAFAATSNLNARATALEAETLALNSETNRLGDQIRANAASAAGAAAAAAYAYSPSNPPPAVAAGTDLVARAAAAYAYSPTNRPSASDIGAADANDPRLINALTNADAFATAAQGAKADTALQPPATNSLLGLDGTAASSLRVQSAAVPGAAPTSTCWVTFSDTPPSATFWSVDPIPDTATVRMVASYGIVLPKPNPAESWPYDAGNSWWSWSTNTVVPGTFLWRLHADTGLLTLFGPGSPTESVWDPVSLSWPRTYVPAADPGEWYVSGSGTAVVDCAYTYVTSSVTINLAEPPDPGTAVILSSAGYGTPSNAFVTVSDSGTATLYRVFEAAVGYTNIGFSADFMTRFGDVPPPSVPMTVPFPWSQAAANGTWNAFWDGGYVYVTFFNTVESGQSTWQADSLGGPLGGEVLQSYSEDYGTATVGVGVARAVVTQAVGTVVLSDAFLAHVGDTNLHVGAAERQSWNAKPSPADVAAKLDRADGTSTNQTLVNPTVSGGNVATTAQLAAKADVTNQIRLATVSGSTVSTQTLSLAGGTFSVDVSGTSSPAITNTVLALAPTNNAAFTGTLTLNGGSVVDAATVTNITLGAQQFSATLYGWGSTTSSIAGAYRLTNGIPAGPLCTITNNLVTNGTYVAKFITAPVLRFSYISQGKINTRFSAWRSGTPGTILLHSEAYVLDGNGNKLWEYETSTPKGPLTTTSTEYDIDVAIPSNVLWNASYRLGIFIKAATATSIYSVYIDSENSHNFVVSVPVPSADFVTQGQLTAAVAPLAPTNNPSFSGAVKINGTNVSDLICSAICEQWMELPISSMRASVSSPNSLLSITLASSGRYSGVQLGSNSSAIAGGVIAMSPPNNVSTNLISEYYVQSPEAVDGQIVAWQYNYYTTNSTPIKSVSFYSPVQSGWCVCGDTNAVPFGVPMSVEFYCNGNYALDTAPVRFGVRYRYRWSR